MLLGLTLAATASAAEPLRLTDDGRRKRDPVFVDGGQAVVYVVDENPVQMRLMRLDLESGGVEPLHDGVSKSEFEPAFSPDGRWYAFNQSTGNLSLQLVIRHREEDRQAVIPVSGRGGMRSPAFTPDGERVLYSFAEGGRQGIYSVNLQGKDRVKLADSPGINNWPSPSPDGSQIAFASSREGNFEIHLMNADGSRVRRLTEHPRQDIRPAFSPDGRRIAFTSARDGNREIYVMRADGTHLRRVTRNPERDDYPVWHPKGKELIFVSQRRGREDLHLVPVR